MEMIKTLYLNVNPENWETDSILINHVKVNILDQIRLLLIDKFPLWAIPKRQNNIIIVDQEGYISEIDF